MRLEVAQPQHSKELVEFFKKFKISGHVDLTIDRGDDFFAAYATQSETYLTFILRGNHDEIFGTASFVIVDAYVNGNIHPVAFGRDLRILQNRKAVMGWSKHFIPAMEEIKRNFKVDYFFTCLNHLESKALNAFVRPRTSKRELPKYFLFRRMNLVSVHGILPTRTNPLPHLKIRRANAMDLDLIIDYTIKKSLTKELSLVWDRESFLNKLKNWNNLNVEDFTIALDSNDNIIGCFALWDSHGIQNYFPQEYSLKGHNFRQFLKFASLFGWTHPLTKPQHRLSQPESLHFKYMCFLNADNEDIFESLLFSAFSQIRKDEFLVYTQMFGDYTLKSPQGWIASETPHGLYNLVLPTEEPPDFVRPTNEKIADIEAFFI